MANPLKDIFEAIDRHEIKKAIDLLNKNPDLLQKRVMMGQTWLHFAAAKNAVEIVRFLVQKGLSVNAADDTGDVPLHSAAGSKAHEAAEWLLDNGAFVDGINLEQSTPLVCAIISDDFEMVKLLRERGARLDLTFTKNKNNIKDVMSFAAIYDNRKIIDYLKGGGHG